MDGSGNYKQLYTPPSSCKDGYWNFERGYEVMNPTYHRLDVKRQV